MDNKSKESSLGRIAKEIEGCKECRLNKIGKAVPGEGNADADIVFIGEAPGKKEAETGRPFVGRSGKLLRKLLEDAGLKEKDVFITSPVKYLPEYVTPSMKDIEHGRIHLFAQLGIINPKIVVLLGNTACLAVLGEKFFISKEHGRIVNKNGINYLITYHPAAPLYSPRLRETIKKDFLKLKELIKHETERI